jgi:hypothetical protein
MSAKTFLFSDHETLLIACPQITQMAQIFNLLLSVMVPSNALSTSAAYLDFPPGYF